MAIDVEANKRTAQAFLDLAFNQRKPEEAVAKYMGKTYRQHNPAAADGPDAFIQFVKGFAAAFPSFSVSIKRAIGDGDLVAVHHHLVTKPGDRGTAVVDILRFEDGKVVEHWDVLQEVPEKAANSNTMF